MDQSCKANSVPDYRYAVFILYVVFIYFLSCEKYSFESLITTGLNSVSAIKLGIAIKPFNVSAIAQASESSTVPAMQAKRQKIT